MARTPKKQKLDLSKAQQADGALKPIHHIYDLVGVKNVSYRAKTYSQYQEMIRRMNLVELHDHAREVNVVPAATKDLMIDRLERKYLQERPEEREKYYAAVQAGKKDEAEMTVAERAALILQRAR